MEEEQAKIPKSSLDEIQTHVEPVRKSSSFDYDADYFGADNADKEEEEKELSWRLDPEESLSDWTVVIHCQDSESSQTYCVHKNILAVGRCKSDYFASLFRNSSRLSESNSDTSHITLEEPAAQVFPVLLDFMYSQRIQIETENAVALRYLSQYFGIRMLHTKVMEFVRDDMKLDTVSTYISNALMFHDERMLSLAENVCVDNIHTMDKSSPLLASINPSFFLRIISSAEIDTCGESSHLSVLVAAYCGYHKDDLDSDTFEQLTSKKHIPLIHRDAAMPLLHLEAAVRDASELDPPSCLQKRCTKVLALSWQDLSLKQEGVDSCKKLPSPILAELLEKSLSAAKQHCHNLERSRNVEAEKLQQVCQEKISGFETTQKTHEDQVKKIQKESAEKIAKLRAAVAERDRQMVEYEKELNRFVRVPVTHSFRSVARDTYHHLSGNEPFDTATTQYDRFGKNRPLAIPQYADSTEDGYLYAERKGTGYDRWPVYFYKDD